MQRATLSDVVKVFEYEMDRLFSRATTDDGVPCLGIGVPCSDCDGVCDPENDPRIEGRYYCRVCRDEHFVTCSKCNTTHHERDLVTRLDIHYCPTCGTILQMCNGCGELFAVGDLTEVSEDHYCPECYKALPQCFNCGSPMHKSYETEWGPYYCDICTKAGETKKGKKTPPKKYGGSVTITRV